MWGRGEFVHLVSRTVALAWQCVSEYRRYLLLGLENPVTFCTVYMYSHHDLISEALIFYQLSLCLDSCKAF